MLSRNILHKGIRPVRRAWVATPYHGQLMARIQRRDIHVEQVSPDETTGAAKYRASLFIDKVFPLKMSSFDIRPYIMSRNIDTMRQKVLALLPEGLPNSFAVDMVEPHQRDGGSIVYFTITGPTTDQEAQKAAQGLVDTINAHVQAASGSKWYAFEPARVFSVMGTPFNEDIVRLLPSKKVKVEFSGKDLSVEDLFREFRPFGRILDIEQQPSSNKDTPRWANVHFQRLRSATSARNCIHGDTVGDTKLSLSYIQMHHENVILQWLKSHSKFTIPLAAAALIAAIYAVFDPIREFFVENKITRRFDISRLPIIGKLRKDFSLWDMLRRDTSTGERVSMWSTRVEQEERLVSMLNEPPENFVVVSGPHGSGKTLLVRNATRNKKYRITIDAAKLSSVHTELEQMTLLAKQLGYWPIFSAIISITNMIDLMVAATTGSKAGISATPESQTRKVLDCLALVLTKIRRDRLIHHQKIAREEHVGSRGAIADENVDDLLGRNDLLPPEDIPIIILENVKDKDLMVDGVMLEWAASMVESGLAHVIATTHSIGGYRDIQRAQPQRAVSLLSLDDASPMNALLMLQSQLEPKAPQLPQDGRISSKDAEREAALYEEQLDAVSSERLGAAVDILGGRLEDLEVFVQKVKAGESIDGSLEDIIQRSITEIRKYAFSGDAEVGQYEHTWSPEQFWYLLTELARNGSVSYDRIRNSTLFVDKDDALLGLEEAQLISMQYENDRPSRIKPGRPIFQAAFQRILDDPGFASSMSVKMNKKFIELETAKIRKAQDELSLMNVFSASVDSHKALMSGLAMISAMGGGGSRSSSWSGRDRTKHSDEVTITQEAEAFFADALRVSNSNSP
ncbi:mitochondrial escape protein 2, partial [Linderina pennispora]